MAKITLKESLFGITSKQEQVKRLVSPSITEDVQRTEQAFLCILHTDILLLRQMASK